MLILNMLIEFGKSTLMCISKPNGEVHLVVIKNNWMNYKFCLNEKQMIQIYSLHKGFICGII